jgi:predicted nucleic acid-binding protein
MKIVIDASVAVKWLISERSGEQDTDRAIAILGAINRGSAIPIQPAHWVAETVAVIARLAPHRALPAIALLTHNRFQFTASRAVYRRAAILADTLNHYMFDTLYQAVALEEDATLVTADERYLAKALPHGRIVSLDEFVVS